MAKKKSFVLKAKHKSKKGGLTAEGRRAYNRATGSNLKRPQPEGGSRKKSYCARSKGQMNDHNIDCSKTPDKRICLARRRWKCNKSLQKSDMPPKAKLAAFLREHLDNKLALKEAEPTITKSNELEKAISPEQQKENIRKQRELQNRQTISELKGFTPASKEYEIMWSGPRDYYGASPDSDNNEDYENFLEDNQYSLPNEFHIVQGGNIVGSMMFGPHKNGKNIHIIESDIKKEHQNKGGEELAQKMAEKHFDKPLLTSKKTQPKPEPTPAPVSSKASHLRVAKSLNADKTGISALMKALKDCACKKSDKLPGGKGDIKDIADFDSKQVQMGLKVELEHTDNKLALKATEPTITKSDEKAGLLPSWTKEHYQNPEFITKSQFYQRPKGYKYPNLPKRDYNEGDVVSHDEVVSSAGRTQNDIMNGTHFESLYPTTQKFRVTKIPVASLYRKGIIFNEVPSKPLEFEGGSEDEEWAKIYSKKHKSGSTAEPIIAHPDGKGGYEIVDGRHRARAAHLRGESHIRAFVPVEPTITKSDEKAGMSALMKALKECACKKSDKLPGGKGDTKDISDFDAKQVEMGLKVEMEHTKDREVAQEIVTDHLSEDPSYYSKLKGSGLADELEKAGRCWEGYEPTPGKKPYSKGSCRKIKKLQKNDNEEYDFNSLEELQNHLNEHHPLEIDEDLVSDYALSNNDYFDPYSDDVVKYRSNYTVHPSVNNDEFEETYLNHFDTLDQMHRQAGEKLKEDWKNQEQKEWEEYQDKYENWANNILKTIHNHCGKGNYYVNKAKTTKSKYISGTKGEDGPEFLIRLSDHPPKDEFDDKFNDKSKKILSLLFPEHTFMRSKDHQEWNRDFNRAEQKSLSFSSKHKIGDHTDVHDFLSNLENPAQKSIKQKLIKALFIQKLQKSISAEAIEAGQYQGEKLDSHHHNRLGVEYKGMAQKAHKIGDKKKAREYHDKALHHFRMADKMGFQQEEPLEKKISGKVAAGLTALAGMMPTQQTTTIADKPPQIEAPKPIIPKEKYPDLGSAENITSLFQLNTGKPLHMFLWNIAQLESTGGENTDHAIITDPESPHYGTKAIGNFALMPNTVKEFVNRYRLNGGKDPRILKIAKMNARSGEINKYIEQNPDIEFKVAGNAAKHVIEKHGYSPEAAYAWKYGHNKTPESIKSPEQQAKMKADKYVSDFKQLMEGGSPKQLTPAIKISKPDFK